MATSSDPPGHLRKLGWFALLYGGSVLVLGGVSLLIRLWIG